MSAERAECVHPRWQRDYEATDNGLCPLCLQAALADAQREVERLTQDAQRNLESVRRMYAMEVEATRQAEQRAAALEDVIRDLFHATAQHHCKVCRVAMKRHAELIRSCEITRAAPRPEGQ